MMVATTLKLVSGTVDSKVGLSKNLVEITQC